MISVQSRQNFSSYNINMFHLSPSFSLHLAGVVLTEISEVHRNVHLELEENVSLEYVFANVYMFCFTLSNESLIVLPLPNACLSHSLNLFLRPRWNSLTGI